MSRTRQPPTPSQSWIWKTPATARIRNVRSPEYIGEWCHESTPIPAIGQHTRKELCQDHSQPFDCSSTFGERWANPRTVRHDFCCEFGGVVKEPVIFMEATTTLGFTTVFSRGNVPSGHAKPGKRLGGDSLAILTWRFFPNLTKSLLPPVPRGPSDRTGSFPWLSWWGACR